MKKRYTIQENHIKRNIVTLIKILWLYIGLSLYKSIDLEIIFVVLSLVFYLIAKSTIKSTQKLRKNQADWDDTKLIAPIRVNLSYQINQIILPPMLAYMLLCGFVAAELHQIYGIFQFIIWLALLIVLSSILFFYVIQYIKLSHRLYRDGFQIFHIQYPFEELKKYQFMKLRKGGYIFEARTAKLFISLKIDDDLKLKFENAINNASTP